MAQAVKCPMAVRETGVGSLGWEGPLEKEMATHSSILSWEIPWTEEPGRLQPMEVTESDVTKQDHHSGCHIILNVHYEAMR